MPPGYSIPGKIEIFNIFMAESSPASFPHHFRHIAPIHLGHHVHAAAWIPSLLNSNGFIKLLPPLFKLFLTVGNIGNRLFIRRYISGNPPALSNLMNTDFMPPFIITPSQLSTLTSALLEVVKTLR